MRRSDTLSRMTRVPVLRDLFAEFGRKDRDNTGNRVNSNLKLIWGILDKWNIFQAIRVIYVETFPYIDNVRAAQLRH